MKATLRNQNLFIRAHEAQHGSNFDRVGSGWENTLTDQFAFLLAADDLSRESVIQQLLGEAAEPVAGITTQVGYEAGCPDLQIELESGRLLLLEHKVDATLGHRQLERYLQISDNENRPARVALIGRKHLPISNEVLGNPQYLRPSDAAHWCWQDVFRWIPESRSAFGSDWLRGCFRQYLELLGLSPSLLVGSWEDLYSSDPEAIPIKEEFRRKMSAIKKQLEKSGFSIEGDSHWGFLARPPKGEAPFLHLAVGPAKARKDHMDSRLAGRIDSAVFQISLVYDSPETPPEALARYEKFNPPLRDGNNFMWYPVRPQTMSNGRTRLAVVSSLDQYLEEESSIADRLFSGFQTAFAAICR